MFPQISFQTEGRQDDAVAEGCEVMVTPAAVMEQNRGQPTGLSSSRWEQAPQGR